jgi:hypothetical protein
MRNHRSNFRVPTFESLENKRCLAVTAMVTAGGDLRVEGAADGAVEIVAVGAGAYRVTDNGVVIADSDVLTGVTDDIRIVLDDAGAGASNSVTLDLTAETTNSVDAIYANLGDGDNSFQFVGGTANSLTYRGGEGDDAVTLGGSIDAYAQLKLGDGDNSLTVSGEIGRLAANAGDGADAVTLADGALVDRNVKLALGDGDNTTTIAGDVDGSLSVAGRDGNDAITIAETAAIADNFFARLGDGENTVTHNGNVGGNFSVTSANENDTVNIADTAVIGGETNLALGEQGEQHEGPGHCHGGEGGGASTDGGVASLRESFGVMGLAGRELGFFFRGVRR